jgi:hypothetical protein
VTREEIERELFKDQCAKSYPTVSRDEATAYVEECKPIAERFYKLEATRLYDEVILLYGRLIWGPLL